MDVTCERCGTEYEFDETLVAARGTTVKCTNCGHLFKVFRPGAAHTSGPEPKSWTVRRATSGLTESIASLKELQRLITVGQLTPDDQISRSGEGWKRLGDIAELQTFFQAAAAAREAQRPPHPDPTGARAIERRPAPPSPDATVRTAALPSAPIPRTGKSTMMGVGGIPGASVDEPPRARTIEVAVPPPPNAPIGTSPGTVTAPQAGGTSLGAVRSPSERPAAPPRAAPPSSRPPPPSSAAASRPLPPPPRAPAETLPEMPAAAAPRQRKSVHPPPPAPTGASERPRPLRVDEDDDVPMRPPTRSRSGLWVAIVVLLALGAGVAAGWSQIVALVQGAGGDPAAPFVAAGDRALRADDHDGYEEAIAQYTKALAHREHDARALTGLSRAHALIAQQRRFEANDLDARAGEDAALRGEAASLRRDAGEHAQAAREHAEEAARHGTGGDPAAQADTEVALSDALRLAGDLELSRSRLDRARTLDATRTAESLRVEALLAADRARDLGAARTLAERAVAEDPGLLRARLLLARAALAAGDVSAARMQVQAVLDRSPEHAAAIALRDAIDRGLPPAAAIVTAADAGAATGAAAGAGSATEPGAGSRATTAGSGAPPEAQAGAGSAAGTSAGGAGAGGPSGDYSQLVREGQARVENGDARGARRYFEAALRAQPSGNEATVGMGYVLLAEGNARGALAQFEAAAGRGYAEGYIGVADAQRRLGDRPAALAAYERYLQLAPAGRSASIAQRQAQRLRDELGTAAAGGTTTTQHHEGGSSTVTTTPSGGAGPSETPETHHDELPAPRESQP